MFFHDRTEAANIWESTTEVMRDIRRYTVLIIIKLYRAIRRHFSLLNISNRKGTKSPDKKEKGLEMQDPQKTLLNYFTI